MLPVMLGAVLTLVNGYALVDVSINGAGPFRMMIDTGATSCSVTAAAARAARLSPGARVVLTTMAGETTVPASHARVRVGGLEVGDVEVLELRRDALSAIGERVDGVLGQGFLARQPYLIDYRQRRVWLGEEAVRRSSRLTTELVARNVSGRMVVPVETESGAGRWRLALDTGANSLVMRCGDRCPKLRGSREDRILTNSGRGVVWRGTIGGVTVGAVSIARAEAALMDDPAREAEDGLLPGNWFSAVYVDSARNVVRLEK